MRFDVVTIFPEFFDTLDISLLGRARRGGTVSWAIHDLRDHTHDRHRTVDDTPYGGGAGMVMRPEPWGEALTQSMARELSQERHLVFGCGRYEGIDQRVFDHTATRARTRLVSIGDYVLNGGEVAVVAMLEAIVRLVPGVVGNPESLVEESHEDGLLEYPSYTKPPEWRGLGVPDVLRSGNHRAIADWRREASLERTRRVRPDLLPPDGDGGVRSAR
jgi:tRNA (guanine37-N1)-methyltransferase